MKFLKVTTLVGASILAAPAAMASTILIDDFVDPQLVSDISPTTSSSFTPVGDLGATRTLSVDLLPGTNPNPIGGLADANLATLVSDGGILALRTGSNRSAQAIVTYDFTGPENLTGSTGINDRFRFFGIDGDLAGTIFTSTVTDSDGSVHSFAEFLGATGPESDTLFSDIQTGVVDAVGGTAGLDFTSIASVSFTFDSVPNFDGQLSSIAVVPLPLSALLLLGGLGGLAGASAVSKRRRKA